LAEKRGSLEGVRERGFKGVGTVVCGFAFMLSDIRIRIDPNLQS
jgi:hypothetical protein